MVAFQIFFKSWKGEDSANVLLNLHISQVLTSYCSIASLNKYREGMFSKNTVTITNNVRFRYCFSISKLSLLENS